MKKRKGFVTNSSSSSFIIAYKQLPEISDELKEQIPILKACETLIQKSLMEEIGSYDTSRAEVFDTLDEWREHWFYENKYLMRDSMERESVEAILRVLDEKEKVYGFSYQHEKDSYLRPAEYLKKGYKIMEKSVSYSDEWLVEILHALEDNENFIIISDDEE